MRDFKGWGSRSLAGKSIGILVVAALAQGCGSSSSSTSASAATTCSTTVTSLQSGICAAQTAMALAPHSADSSPTAFNFLPGLYHRASMELAGILFPDAMATGSGLAAFWTGSTSAHDLYEGQSGYSGTGYESPQNWMAQEMDESFVNSGGAAVTPFGRAAQDQFMACIMGAMTNQSWSSSIDTDNLLKVGSYGPITVSFPTSIGSTFMGCSVPSTIASFMEQMGNATVSLSVASVSPSTYYTKAYTMVFTPQGQSAQTTTYYLGLDVTNHNMYMGVVEEQRSALQHQNPWALDRQLLQVKGSVTDFEYVAQSYCANGTNCTDTASTEGGVKNSIELYRIHIDTGSNVAYVFGNYGQYDDALASGDSSNNASESFTRYALAGKPNSLNSIATSMSLAGMGQGTTYISVSGGTPDSEGNGCVSASDGSESNDGNLNCDINGVDLTGNASKSGLVEATIIAHASSSTSYDSTAYKMDGNTIINWSTFDTNTSTGMFGVPSTSN